MNKLCAALIVINFITVLFPQPSYIHPDEFFQSTEIVAGDVLNVSHFRVWEFNESSPVRSIVFPYILLSPSLHILKWINSTGLKELRITAVKIVIATRLPFAFLTLLGYVATEKLAVAFGVNQYLCCVLYCTSYVTWIYSTRTFSNSVEAALFAIILILMLDYLKCYELKKKLNLVRENETKFDSHCYDRKQARGDQKKELQKSAMDSMSASKAGATDSMSASKAGATDSMSASKAGATDSMSASKAGATDSMSASKAGATDSMSSSKENDISDRCSLKQENVSTLRRNLDDDVFKILDVNKVKDEKTRKIVIDKAFNSCGFEMGVLQFLLGLTIVAGFFNRPTFLAFSFVPTLFWLRFSDSLKNLVKNMFIMSHGALVCCIFFVLCDTCYFNSDFLRNVKVCADFILSEQFSLKSFSAAFEILASSLVFTPWNFVRYNMNSANLAQHGLHPFYTHSLVNLPLLFGPVSVSLVAVFISAMFRRHIPSNNSLFWLVSMTTFPVIFLSAFPHQEPRFLIPALPVFMVMGAKFISGLKFGKRLLLASWVFFNLVMVFIYGYLHQAALIPVLSNYQLKICSSPLSYHHLIFYKTYPPPRHLLIIDSNKSNVRLTDFSSASIEDLFEEVKLAQLICHENKDSCQVSVFLPSSLTSSLTNYLSDHHLTVTSICPHLSMEAPPRWKSWWENKLSFDEFILEFCLNIVKIN